MNRKTLLLCPILALSLIAAGPATAQLETVGRRLRIGSEPVLPVANPAVAVDAEGRAMVVWSRLLVDAQSDYVERIYGQLLRPDGTPAGAPRPIDEAPAYSQAYPEVAAVGAGRFVVFWSRWEFFVSEPEEELYEVYGRFVDASGRPRGAQFHVNTLSPFWQVQPAVAVSPADELFVVWVTGDPGDAGPWPQILGARRLASNGTPLGPELQVNNLGSSPAESDDPRPVGVATALTGVSMVVWSSHLDVYARRYGPGGAPLGPEMRLDDESPQRFDRGPSVAVDAAGNFVVIWGSKEGFTSPPEILARAVDRQGVLGPVYSLGAALDAFELTTTALAADPFGSFVAAWASPSGSRVAVRQLTASGEPVGDSTLVTIPGQIAGTPDLAVGPGGDFRLVFAGVPADRGAGAEIFTQRLRRRAAGSCVGSATALCLQGARFRLEVTWKDFSGHGGLGRAVPLTADTGYFWFFSEDNVEVVVKVLDGRAINDHFWVFFGALSNVEYTLRVTDTETGEGWTRFNPPGVLASVADTAAF